MPQFAVCLSICPVCASNTRITSYKNFKFGTRLPITCSNKSFLRSKANLTLRNFVVPGPIITKLCTVDYAGDPYLDANFS